MNLGTAVACLPSSRNIYSINPHETSTVSKRRSFATSRQRSKSHQLESIKEQHVLYSNSSQDCPCDHHRLSRLREDSHKNFDDIISASFEASLAPFRGLLTPSTSTGDSGVNTNSNGSRRSSGRAVRERNLSSSSSSSTPSDLDAVVTTTVIVEQNGCEDNSPQSSNKKESDFWQRNNRIIIQQRSDLIQISPQIDPSQNWTLIKANTLNEDLEDEADSLFSSLKTSHSSSLKALHCTCPKTEVEPPFLLRRTASYPRCNPKIDPHRFQLRSERPLILDQSLRQLPTVPPDLFWPPSSSQNQNSTIPAAPRVLTHYSSTRDFVKNEQPQRRLQHRNASFPVFNGLHEAAFNSASQHEIPPCVRNVIMHQIKSPKLAAENPKKKIKKLSKTITLPEDPYDPTAFTLHFDQYDEYSLMRKQQIKNARARKSRHTVKIVGSFSFLMTIGIVITVLCFLYWSNNFKPMTMM